MIKYLIDTNFLKFLMSPDGQHLKDKLACHIGQMAISSISIIEIETALEESKSRDQDENAVTRLLSCFQLLPFEHKDAQATGKLLHQARNGRRSEISRGAFDVQIAGQAIAQGLILVTSSESHYNGLTGLKISNWLLD